MAHMTNAELADFLNDNLGLAGTDAVTANVIRQWIAWDVLPKAKAHGRGIGQGPTWHRSDAAMRRALRLGELRKRGICRENAVIVQTYIEWGHPDFDRVREALLNELVKWAAQLNRHQTTFIGDSNFPEMSVTKHRAIANQLGPLDDRLKGTQFERSAELYAVFAETARTGHGNSEYLTALMLEAAHQIVPAFSKMLPAHCISQFANSFAGLTGPSDEIGNSGERAILSASERKFRIARLFIRRLLSELRKCEQHARSPILDVDARQLAQMLHSLYPQISVGPWLILPFVQLLKIAPEQ